MNEQKVITLVFGTRYSIKDLSDVEYTYILVCCSKVVKYCSMGMSLEDAYAKIDNECLKLIPGHPNNEFLIDCRI